MGRVRECIDMQWSGTLTSVWNTNWRMERKISLKGKPDRNYTVKPSMRPGGYPGSAPVAPPHGSYGVGGYPSGATPAQHPTMPHQQHHGGGGPFINQSQLPQQQHVPYPACPTIREGASG